MDLMDTGQNHIGFMLQASDGFTQFVPQFGQMVTTQIFHFNRFQVVPDALIHSVNLHQTGRICLPIEVTQLGQEC